MAYFGKVRVRIDSDWATFQLMTQGARVEPLIGHEYPTGTNFGENRNGFVFGQPNEGAPPRVVEIPFGVRADVPVITFFTGKGDGGTGGPQAGFIVVELGDGVYPNENVTGDGLNIEGFFNAALQ